jgi:hypothetical protein
VTTLFIEPGSSRENGYVESFNGKLRDEFLNREIFYSVAEARVLTERWRIEYNTRPPHSSLGYRPPAPETIATSPLLGGAFSLLLGEDFYSTKIETGSTTGVASVEPTIHSTAPCLSLALHPTRRQSRSSSRGYAR